MNLADSWTEDTPTAAALVGFHDEVEEHDEVDEAEDGCGGVVWLPYVLKKPHTTNKMLHELAREIRGVERKRGKKLRGTRYKTICDKWQSASRPFLRRVTITLLNFRKVRLRDSAQRRNTASSI